MKMWMESLLLPIAIIYIGYGSLITIRGKLILWINIMITEEVLKKKGIKELILTEAGASVFW